MWLQIVGKYSRTGRYALAGLLLIILIVLLNTAPQSLEAAPVHSVVGQGGSSVRLQLDQVPTTLSPARGVSAMAWGDVDGDGDLDLAVGGNGRANVVYLNDRGTFTREAWNDGQLLLTSSVAWGDVDGDGDLDLAVGHRNGPTQLYLNEEGALSETPHWGAGDGMNTRAIAWGDLNGDGYLDLLAGNYEGSNVIYANTGTGTLETEPAWSDERPDDKTTSLDLADYDGDGDLDFVIGNYTRYTFPDTPTIIYQNQGTGGFIFDNVWEGSNAAVSDVAWGDLQGDGFAELALVDFWLGNSIGSADGVYANENGMVQRVSCPSLGIATCPTWRPELDSLGSSVAWGDVDGDGDLDLAIGSSTDLTERVYLNEGGSLNSRPEWESASLLRAADLAWVDVDRDGDLDLTVIYNGLVNVYLNHLWPLAVTPSWRDRANFIRSNGLAWGDYDNDGDLDLAVANGSPDLNPVQPALDVVYPNNGGLLDYENAIPVGDVLAVSTSVAWGDVNGDGFLDLAVAYLDDTNRVFLNDQNGGFAEPIVLPDVVKSWSVAFGDVDNDGDLDLAVGNENLVNRLYLNEEGDLLARPPLVFGTTARTSDLAWGDVDGDGDLDLAEGNFGGRNRVYLNENGLISNGAYQEFPDEDATTSVAWGDVDGDGRLDLAVGIAEEANRLYQNAGGRLNETPVWLSLDRDITEDVAFGDVDGDGDLDLAVANSGGADGAAPQASRVYLNEDGRLQTIDDAPWTTALRVPSYAVVWGDVDRDGDLDLAFSSGPTTLEGSPRGSVSNALYENRRIRPADPRQPAQIILGYESSAVTSPAGMSYTVLDPAEYSALAGIRDDGTVPIPYTLLHPEDKPVYAVRAYYSLNGGGRWYEAAPAAGTQTTNLSTTAGQNEHVYTWDVFASNLYGQSDNVIFRLEAYTALPATNALPAGTFQYPDVAVDESAPSYVAAQTRPFRVRGNQIRVFHGEAVDENAVAGALVYRIPAGQETGGMPLAGEDGQPYLTDSLGFLQGRGILQPGDRLVALWPVPQDEVALPFLEPGRYTLYYMSAGPDERAGLALADLSAVGGIQNLVVSEVNPLLLFHVNISLEWDARQDESFLIDLANNLQNASELLFDVSNGQVALGTVQIFHDRHYWNNVDVHILADNNLRPTAAIGGVVRHPVAETVLAPAGTQTIDNAYWPGQIRMGPVWDPFGENVAELGEDWWRALAHELAHYLLFLPDNYLGFNESGVLSRINCQGSFMTSTYDPAYSEFLTEGQWLDDCLDSLAERTTGRDDWQTITLRYPMLQAPDEVAPDGPALLPLNVTNVFSLLPTNERLPRPARNFDVRDADNNRFRLPAGQAYVIQRWDTADPTDDTLIALGSPTGGGDRLKVRGAHTGDRLCLYGTAGGTGYAGCVEDLRVADVSLRVSPVEAGWQPQISVEPETATTLRIAVQQELPAGDTVHAQVYPAHYGSAPCNFGLAPVVELVREGEVHTGEAVLKWPDYEVAVRVWAGDGSGRETIAHFTLILPPATPEEPLFAEPPAAEAEEALLPAEVVAVDPVCQAAGTAPGRDPNAAVLSYYLRFLANPNTNPLGGPNTNPLGGPNTNPLGGPNTTPLGGPNTNPLGGPNTNPLGGPNTNPLGGPNTNPLGGPNTNPLGGPNTNPLGGPNTNPLGGPNNVPSGGAFDRPAFAPSLSTDAQAVIYSAAGYFGDSGVLALQQLPAVPLQAAHPWLVPVGRAYRLRFDPAVTDGRVLALTYLQREVPEGYEHTLGIYFLADGEDSTWERIPSERYVENLIVAQLPDYQDGTYAIMATIELPELQTGWNLVAYPLPVSRTVTATLSAIADAVVAVRAVTWDAGGVVTMPPAVNSAGTLAATGVLDTDVAYFEFGKIYWIYVVRPVTLPVAPPTLDPAGQLR